jgi:voltage-gated potassium channel
MTLRQHNFFYLLAGLLFLLLGMPLFLDLSGASDHYVSELTFSAFLMIAVWSTYGGARHLFLLGIILAVLGVGSNVLALAGISDFFVYLSLCRHIIFLLLTIVLAIREVLRSRTVDANSIVGAACIYLLIGVIWSLFYVLVNIFIPDSFSVQINGGVSVQQQHLLYFSFVTLTTLGYGDITPIGATARALSTIEAVIGQFYMAILVAGLISIFVNRKKPTPSGD